jgi:hypothetical protein
MPDMLVRLYDLPDSMPYYQRCAAAGFTVSRAEAWDRARLREFVKQHFGANWANEVERAFYTTPITAYIGTKGGELAGFGAYNVTRPDYFGPTGVREDLRGGGLGAALLFRCLESLRELGYAYAIIGGVGPAEYYEKTVGAFTIPGSDPGIYAPLYEQRRGDTNG